MAASAQSVLAKVVDAPADATDELWYRHEAKRWLEALPLGNGFLGGMVFGGVEVDRVALSEATAWSGAPGSGEVNPEALQHLPEIRQLLFAGKYAEAKGLCEKYLTGRGNSFGTNLPLPELRLELDASGEVTEYRRSLDLDEAMAKVQYRRGGAFHEREYFASHPDRVLVARFHSSAAEGISLHAGFGELTIPAEVTVAGDTLILRGHAYEKKHSNGQQGVAVQIHVRVLAEGGSVIATQHGLSVKGAKVVTVLVTIATDFAGANPEEICERQLARAAAKNYARLREDHVADHRALYRRVALRLGTGEDASQPTDVRRRALENGAKDPALVALFFQYGRYLTIAGSREDSVLPLALQGIWNDGLASGMGWTDDFHLDINTEQNYWAAEVCNLAECQLPLFSFIDSLRVAGRKTAREMYGAPGWVCHTVANPWGYTAPGGGLGWGLYVTAGVWIARQLWEHYTFGAGVEFLRARAYPVLRESAEFFLAYMVPEPVHGWLVTGPSDSPENWYVAPSGEHCAESMGCTIDRVFVYALFSMCIESAETLGVDEVFRRRLEDARAKLPPFQVGRHGQLQEWLVDFEDAIPNHRHTSHLTSLYPENQISPWRTPELARAAEVTLERRLNAPHWEQSEWGRANLVAYYARLLKGDAAHDALVGLIGKAVEDNLLSYSSAGVAGADQNIFALDGNTAGTGALAEMLVQSQDGEIHLLPALPAAWPEGAVHGLSARGGFEAGVEWRQGALRSAVFYSRRGGRVPVRYGDKVVHVALRAGERKRLTTADFAL